MISARSPRFPPSTGAARFGAYRLREFPGRRGSALFFNGCWRCCGIADRWGLFRGLRLLHSFEPFRVFFFPFLDIHASSWPRPEVVPRRQGVALSILSKSCLSKIAGPPARCTSRFWGFRRFAAGIFVGTGTLTFWSGSHPRPEC